MAHLTEETQPLFETTLKSRAVSETANVKFTCVISGYPVPELTWYKDDMELDRYCGLPKYEIFRHGKTHTLHIYNCTEEDAAVYQASARNCKGIVSCSGVLEVGSMNEYRIHQRFFTKLKQKAEAKRREREESRLRGEKAQPRVGSPERVQRKRRSPGEAHPGVPPLPRKAGVPAVAEGAGHPVVEAEIPNGYPSTAGNIPVDVPSDAGKEEGGQFFRNMGSPTKEPLAKKKIKTTNGTASENTFQKSAPGSGPEKEPRDGGMSLSQYLAAESQQAQVSPEETLKRGKERWEAVEQLPPSSKGSPVKARVACKEPEQHNAQSPLTSVFFSLRDIFFRGKKNAEDVVQDGTAGPLLPGTDSLPDGILVDSNQVAEVGELVEPEEMEHQPTDAHVTHSTSKAVCPDVPDGLVQGLMSREESTQILSENRATSTQWENEQDKIMASVKGGIIKPDPVPRPLQECTVLHDPLPTEGHDTHGSSEMELAVQVMQEVTPTGKWAAVQEMETDKSRGGVLSASSEQTESTPVYFKEVADNSEPTAEPLKTDLVNNRVTSDLLDREDFHINEGLDKNANNMFETRGDGVSIGDGKNEMEIKETAINGDELGTRYFMETPVFLQLTPQIHQHVEETIQNEVKDTGIQIKVIHESDNLNPVSPNLFIPEAPEAELSAIVPKVDVVMETKNKLSTAKDADQSHLQRQEREVSELVAKESHVLVAPVAPDVAANLQNMRNDVAHLLSNEDKPEITQQGEKDGMEDKRLLETRNSNNVPFINVFFEDPILLSNTISEPSSALITSVLPHNTEKIIDAKDDFHSKLTLAPDNAKVPQEATVDSRSIFDELHTDKSSVEVLSPTNLKTPLLSPTTLRRFASQRADDLGTLQGSGVPAIQVESIPLESTEPSRTPSAIPSCESSPKMRRRDSLGGIPSATPEELASGARRKIFAHKAKGEDPDGAEEQEAPGKKEQEPSCRSPPQTRRGSTLHTPTGQNTPPTERRSPFLSRRRSTLEVPKNHEETLRETETPKTDTRPAEKEKLNPFKAPQVIRKIRGELYSDASGHLKLWCQFFNVLSDSTIKWYRDEVEIAEVKRSAGDERPLALAIVQVNTWDCGVYGCSIKNEYGSDSTDYLLSADILSQFFFREDVEVGEEVEMTPLLFAKGLADPGCWGAKLFGRIMNEESNVGEGCGRKTSRVKAIYGLEPIFVSGNTCILKVRNPITYGSQEENALTERNVEITKQECKIQNTVREYCKIFAAEARTKESFGPSLEVNPVYLMYRPANMVPYATVEIDLQGTYVRYCRQDSTGRLVMRNSSETEQKCCAFQHWIHQWTSGNLLVTQLEGVDMKITNISVATKSRGYQGLSDEASPQVFEQFPSLHQCNYYCGLLGLRTLRSTDSMQQSAKTKPSRSPLIARKMGGTSSPQQQRKGSHSPQTARKSTSSPKVVRKAGEVGEGKATKQKTAEIEQDV
ncbi:alpha-protein kinase 3 isoform X2 [Brienomyrus brachyistius]|nr:alpha-protein kinase 3 isoform X2 [Brienomyrus brachyistius]